MSIRARVCKLESVVGSRPRDCPGCGFPSKGVIRIVVTNHDKPLPTCAACNRPLDTDGMPLHTPYKRYILEHPERI